jgi:hypothetical protein
MCAPSWGDRGKSQPQAYWLPMTATHSRTHLAAVRRRQQQLQHVDRGAGRRGIRQRCAWRVRRGACGGRGSRCHVSGVWLDAGAGAQGQQRVCRGRAVGGVSVPRSTPSERRRKANAVRMSTVGAVAVPSWLGSSMSASRAGSSCMSVPAAACALHARRGGFPPVWWGVDCVRGVRLRWCGVSAAWVQEFHPAVHSAHSLSRCRASV